MQNRYSKITIKRSVPEAGDVLGCHATCVQMESNEDLNCHLGHKEKNFIEARDSFYMATVSRSGWPYVQHRGGPIGFMRVLDDKTIGFADFAGNRQYISTGNLRDNNRVALIFTDYPNRRRLKLFGRVKLIECNEYELLKKLEIHDYRARVERGFIIGVGAYDWNCSQHITPRYTQAHIDKKMKDLESENQRLKMELSVPG